MKRKSWTSTRPLGPIYNGNATWFFHIANTTNTDRVVFRNILTGAPQCVALLCSFCTSAVSTSSIRLIMSFKCRFGQVGAFWTEEMWAHKKRDKGDKREARTSAKALLALKFPLLCQVSLTRPIPVVRRARTRLFGENLAVIPIATLPLFRV